MKGTSSLDTNPHSPQLREIVEQMKPQIRELAVPVLASAERISHHFKKLPPPIDPPKKISTSSALRQLDERYYQIRKVHLENRTLASLHPAIRQVSTFLYLPLSLVFFFLKALLFLKKIHDTRIYSGMANFSRNS